MRGCEGTRLNVQEGYVQVLDEFVKWIRVFLRNKFKYDMYGKCNQQERRVTPTQVL
jgi:hypothetical protein